FLKCLYGCKTRNIFFQALISGQSEPGGRPASEIREACACSYFGHHVQRCPRAVPHGDQGPDARTGYAIDGNSSFAQNAKYPDVRNAACKSACKGQADARALLGFALFAVCEGSKLVLCGPQPAQRPRGFALFRHFSSLAPSPRINPSFDPRMLVL